MDCQGSNPVKTDSGRRQIQWDKRQKSCKTILREEEVITRIKEKQEVVSVANNPSNEYPRNTIVV